MKTCGYGMILTASALLLCAGCAGVKTVYTEVPTDGVALVDHEGDLLPECIKDKTEQDLIRMRTAEGYRLVARAEFTVQGGQSWTEGMVKKGREIKAGKIDYIATFDALSSGIAQQGLKPSQSSTMAELTVGETDMAAPMMPDASSSHSGLGGDKYMYHVYYFKKLK